MDNFDNILTEEALRKRLGFSESYMRTLREMGIPHIRLGRKTIRYDCSAVQEWLKGFAVTTSGKGDGK